MHRMFDYGPFADWHTKRLRDFTLEDAMQAFNEGFYSICNDGKVECLTNDEDYRLRRRLN